MSESAYLDIADSNFAISSDEVEQARETNWYAKTNYGLAVLSYEDNAALMKSKNLKQGSAEWPDLNGVHSGVFYDWWKENLLVLEGDDHDRLRRLVQPAFSPRKIKDLGDRFDALANELIDNWIDKGEVEFVEEFAAPFATRVLCIMLGIPETEWAHINDLGSKVGAALGITIKEQIETIDAALKELQQYGRDLLEDRRKNPQDDFVTRLVEANAEGDQLSNEELENMIVLLIFGGMDTTRNQLGLALSSFAKQPDQWEKLAADPDKYRKAAVEEALRLNPTTRWVTREAAETFEHKGLTIEKGTTVHMFTETSGRDPEAFEDPNRIDLDAVRKPHFAFGGGAHHCIGHFVARSDMMAALPALATRITDLKLGEDQEWLPDSGNTGPERLPVSFTKR
ncbi:cytochrome P450 [Canibacter zhoujuaniae]|uniref:cytochrome P450 n=1 Tax=Canibacter zhoujuaniae TaxID=2708343 RepID=UPI00141F2348|nr:cytochrome P450 [Canibacter zhoujuaniae]